MKKWIFVLVLMLLPVCTGEELLDFYSWEPHDGFGGVDIESKGDYTYCFEYGNSSWGYEPPYRTTVFDQEDNRLFSVDAEFVQYFDVHMNDMRSGLEDGFGVVEFSDGKRGIISDRGEILIDGLSDVDGFYNGYAYYARAFESTLLNKILSKLDLEIGYCGRIDMEGNRLDIIGGRLRAPDEEGYMRLQTIGNDFTVLDTDRYAYVDAEGKAVIQKVFERAYPFKDGSAVVKYGGEYMLIDPKGKKIRDVSFEWGEGVGYERAYACKLAATDGENGMFLIDRKGNIVNDTPWKFVSAGLMVFRNNEIWLCEDFDGLQHFVDADGNDLFALDMEDMLWADDTETIIWAKVDGLWGRVDCLGVEGEPGYTSDDRYVELKLSMGRIEDIGWVEIDENGSAIIK